MQQVNKVLKTLKSDYMCENKNVGKRKMLKFVTREWVKRDSQCPLASIDSNVVECLFP